MLSRQRSSQAGLTLALLASGAALALLPRQNGPVIPLSTSNEEPHATTAKLAETFGSAKLPAAERVLAYSELQTNTPMLPTGFRYGSVIDRIVQLNDNVISIIVSSDLRRREDLERYESVAVQWQLPLLGPWLPLLNGDGKLSPLVALYQAALLLPNPDGDLADRGKNHLTMQGEEAFTNLPLLEARVMDLRRDCAGQREDILSLTRAGIDVTTSQDTERLEALNNTLDARRAAGESLILAHFDLLQFHVSDVNLALRLGARLNQVVSQNQANITSSGTQPTIVPEVEKLLASLLVRLALLPEATPTVRQTILQCLSTAASVVVPLGEDNKVIERSYFPREQFWGVVHGLIHAEGVASKIALSSLLPDPKPLLRGYAEVLTARGQPQVTIFHLQGRRQAKIRDGAALPEDQGYGEFVDLVTKLSSTSR